MQAQITTFVLFLAILSSRGHIVQACLLDTLERVGAGAMSAVVQAAALSSQLNDTSLSATALAPTNTAFQKLAIQLGMTTEQFLNETDILQVVIGYHVLPGAILSSSLFDEQSLTTLLPNTSLTVAVIPPSSSLQLDSGVFLVPMRGVPAKLLQPDMQLPGCPSLVHIIDEVLVPQEAAHALGLYM